MLYDAAIYGWAQRDPPAEKAEHRRRQNGGGVTNPFPPMTGRSRSRRLPGHFALEPRPLVVQPSVVKCDWKAVRTVRARQYRAILNRRVASDWSYRPGLASPMYLPDEAS